MKLLKILKEIRANQPAPNRPAPSREPMTIPSPTKEPKRGPRRQIGEPAPGVNPKPKAEGKYGWDQKKGLTQTPKPPITKDNKPKKEGLEDKIVKRFQSLKK